MKNLKKCRTEKGYTLERLCSLYNETFDAGLNKGTLSKYENGKQTPMVTVINNLASLLNVSVDYLLSDESLPNNCIPVQNSAFIPIIGVITAGIPILAEENIIGHMPLDVRNPSEHFLLKVSGDSMINARIYSGDLVLIHKQNTAENGDIVACLVNSDSATLKRFKQIKDKVILMPENSVYEPMILSTNDFEEGFAQIIGVAKRVVFEL